MADALWYWHRLQAMDAAELWHRIIEKARHVTEPLARGAIKNARITQKHANHPLLPAREEAPALLKQTLANDSAKLLAGKWALFGWKEVQVPSPPDWHRDYMHGMSVPTTGKQNHRSLPGGADVRAIWEINRWAEIVRLAMHGWMNDDVAAIQLAQEWLGDWVEQNPLGKGVNWTSALEGGLRLINFCWFDALVLEMAGGRSEIGGRQRELRDVIVSSHVWWVRRYLSIGSSANNHRLGELTGLLLAVKRWPELERIAGSANELWQQITECVLSQFAEDGGNREQALHYHLFAFEMALHACRVMNMRDGPVVKRLQCAAEFFVRMSHPQEPWDYGDNDDAEIVPLTMNREKSVAEWCAWMSGASGGETLRYWFVGPSLDRMNSAMIPPEGGTTNTDWWLAPQSGMAVIQHDGWKVRVDASPLGFGKMAAHGHCDALHVSVWDGEHARVIDRGTGGYFGAKEVRADLASWNAHNGPQPVGGFNTPRRMGTFLWAEHHENPSLRCHEDSIHVSLQLDKTEVSRSVRFKDGAVFIEDALASEDCLQERWSFAPECELNEEAGASNSMLIGRGKNRWHIEFVANGLEISANEEVASPAYGKILQAPVIDVVAKGGVTIILRRMVSGA